MVLTAIMFNAWETHTMRTATDVRCVSSSSLLNQMNTAAIHWRGSCSAKPAIWTWFLASTNTGLGAETNEWKHVTTPGLKIMGDFACAFYSGLQMSHIFFNNEICLFFLSYFGIFLLQYIVLSENPPFLILYLIHLHSIKYKMHQIYLCNSLFQNVRRALFEFFVKILISIGLVFLNHI